MLLLRHNSIASMLIVDGDVELITKTIWNSSDSIAVGTKRFFYIQELTSCELDPGGLLFWKTPWIRFSIDGINFDVQISRAGEMLHLLEYAEERIPGYIRFLTFGMFVIISKELFNKVKIKLKEIEMSDEGLNAELEELEIKRKL